MVFKPNVFRQRNTGSVMQGATFLSKGGDNVDLSTSQNVSTKLGSQQKTSRCEMNVVATPLKIDSKHMTQNGFRIGQPLDPLDLHKQSNCDSNIPYPFESIKTNRRYVKNISNFNFTNNVLTGSSICSFEPNSLQNTHRNG